MWDASNNVRITELAVSGHNKITKKGMAWKSPTRIKYKEKFSSENSLITP
jgi:hypothetical protein